MLIRQSKHTEGERLRYSEGGRDRKTEREVGQDLTGVLVFLVSAFLYKA